MFKHGFNCAVTVLYIPTQNLEDLPVLHAGPKLEELSSVCQKNCPMYVGRIVRCISEELACVCMPAENCHIYVGRKNCHMYSMSKTNC